ncbi:hypothetical protein MVEN_01821600 [Mycena venus]|uniref:Rhodopsin domain-containing protein n=1 Tax=Mycena venus TaxID=2733690 RepID=A0A8H6XJS2_9AGAR|nr:hypothetical protein MVEN_01821600 [Mycena venus]
MTNLNDPLVQLTSQQSFPSFPFDRRSEVNLQLPLQSAVFFALGEYLIQVCHLRLFFRILMILLSRLYQRRGKFGADDSWAAFSSVAMIVQIVAISLYKLPKKGGAAVFYMTGITFYAIVWGSRLSILFSIIRIDPTSKRRRRLFGVAVAFIVVSLVLVAQLFWVCDSENSFDSWKNAPNQGCHLPLQVAVFQLITDIIADSILLFAPMSLFRNLINKALCRRLTLIFSTCVVTTIVSLIHSVLILSGNSQALIAGLLEVRARSPGISIVLTRIFRTASV